MQELRCKKCGLALEQRGDKYVCLGCGAEYQAEDARRVADEMARLLDEQKQERVANLRQQLWKEFNEEFYDRAEISRLAKGIMAYLPDDFFAQFCDLATGRDTRRLNAFLYVADVKAQSMYIWDMLAFLLRPLREETLLAVNDLLARAGAAGLDMEGFRRCNEQLAREAEKLNAGVYDVTLPRDVFLAYSSADMAQVGELVEALEAQKISCFVAARNLQHGAIQNYEEQLRRAMDHCRTVVFVSSKNSRSRTCDALSTELPYIRERDIAAAPQYRNDYAGMPARYKKPRIEYLVDAHTHTAADSIVEEFFEGCEYCYDADTAAQRILKMLSQSRAPAVKYCLACGAENAKKAKFCMECGGKEFVDTYEEYESRRHTDTDSEIARLRAEVERLKKEAQQSPAPKASPLSDFEIENGVLRKYKGTGGDVVIPNNVKSIGNSAFQFSMRLISITIPNSVTSIGEKAFNYCMGLTSITIPSSITSIEGGAFEGCSGLTSITIPNSVTEIGDKAFRGCTGLTSITIPDSMTNIRDGVFDGCKGLISITIPNSVKSIGNSAFQWCTGLTSITLPSSVKSIGKSVFESCTGLRNITIPNSVTSIGESAFENCTGLTSITIPNSVTSIGNRVFWGCTELTSITIPDSVTSIESETFSNCTGLKSIMIPDSVTEIGMFAFMDCTGLISISIPSSVTSIKYRAFMGCTGLTSITIPSSVMSVGDDAFRGCTGLTSITIPNSVKIIGDAFEGCDKAKIYCYRQRPKRWPEGWDKSLQGKIIWDKSDFEPTAKLSTVASPLSDFEIENGELKKYKGKGGDVVIPDSVTRIGYRAFYGCTGLTSITIPNSVTNIGMYAFLHCNELTDIAIPNSVTRIGEWAFRGCTKLTSVMIPNGVKKIGVGVFYGCKRLTSLIVDHDNPVYHSDGNCLIQTKEKVLVAGCKTSVIPTDGSVRSIADDAFDNCTGLTSITIPNSVSIIGNRAFESCTGLTNITIPDSMTEIGSSAFWNCTGLTSITIPNSVKSIGKLAFACCGNAQIYCHAKEPEEWPAGWDESLKDRIIWDE